MKREELIKQFNSVVSKECKESIFFNIKDLSNEDLKLYIDNKGERVRFEIMIDSATGFNEWTNSPKGEEFKKDMDGYFKKIR